MWYTSRTSNLSTCSPAGFVDTAFSNFQCDIQILLRPQEYRTGYFVSCYSVCWWWHSRDGCFLVANFGGGCVANGFELLAVRSSWIGFANKFLREVVSRDSWKFCNFVNPGARSCTVELWYLVGANRAAFYAIFSSRLTLQGRLPNSTVSWWMVIGVNRQIVEMYRYTSTIWTNYTIL